jgi:3-methylcrotonyl-CoA carboxylase alpha subunit
VRVDAGVREGDTVTMFYDPMIAKLIAHAPTRKAAVAKLAGALVEVEVADVRTNNAFLIRALRHPEFAAGGIDTGFVARHLAELVPPHTAPQHILSAAARFVVGEHAAQDGDDPWGKADSFRLAGAARRIVEFVMDGKRVSGDPEAPSSAHVLRLASGDIAVMEGGETFVLHPHDPLHDMEEEGEDVERIHAPMPGRVIQVHVKAGQAVRRGDPLVVLEAMKMEHTLSAPHDATIESVDAAPGEQIAEGAVLVRFAEPPR